jgi:hypothetical protein
MFDFRELFLDQLFSVFDLLLEAQLSGEDHRRVEKLRTRFMKMAELAGPDLVRKFMKEALWRLGESAPEVRDRLIEELAEKGVFLRDTSSADVA